jgi:4-amino-4-deoxy-L-arabinose transferase-like glycosyltransferase
MKTTNVSTGRYWFYFFLLVAIAFKFSLFFYIVTVMPGAVLKPDSFLYLQGADSIRNFFLHPQYGLTHSAYSLPGYPLILAGCLYGLGLSIYQMVFIQILLNFLTAFVVARIARSINPNWAALSALIVLLDLPLTVYSQIILTEAVFILVLSCFILCLNRYLAIPSYRRLILAAFILVLCMYIRPITCYLPWLVAAFIICLGSAGHWKKNLAHACLLVLVCYGLCLPWQYRNFKRYGDARMSSIAESTFKVHSFFKDSDEKKALIAPNAPNYVYYPFSFSRNVLELLTTPGSVSHCRSLSWMAFSKIFGYCVIVFWLPGFLMGLTWGQKDLRYSFLIWVFLYFLFATIGAVGWTVTSRFRIAMLPSIAVISTAGWFKVRTLFMRLYGFQKNSDH